MIKNELKKAVSKKYNSFSLGEFIIALGVVGILAMILMPMLLKSKPDENEVLHKKATFIVERVVNEISTDEFLYPKGSEYSGLSNTSAVTVNGETHVGVTKFCTLFASRLNKASGTSVNCKFGEKSITSAEGMDWYLPISDFKGNDYEIIMVDVNGSKGPNCMYKNQTCYHPDQFEYKIRKGTKVTVKNVGNLEATAPPAARPNMPDEPNGDTTDPRTGQKWYCIRCNAPANGRIFGYGCNKPNGHYQLVAIPNIGYKGSWFTKSVTVNNADVPESECNVTFTPIVDIPKADGGTVTPPPTPPEPTEPEKTYCINVTKIGGDTTQCAVAGDGCGKKPGTYVVSASGKGDYKTNWTTKDVTIVDSNVNLTLNCDKEPEPEECYSITTTGDTTNCPVSLPAGTCKTDPNKYTAGTYSYTVTPKAGYSYGGQAAASTKQIIVSDKNVSIPIECSVQSQQCVISGNIKEQPVPGNSKDCQIEYSFTINPAATKYVYITMHLQGGGSYVTAIPTGATQPIYNPSYVTLPGGVCDPVVKVTNDAGCDVNVNISEPQTQPEDNSCSIILVGTGNIGAAMESGTVNVVNTKGTTSAVLNKGNGYKATLNNLTCGLTYSINPECGKTGSMCKFDATANPSSIANLKGNQTVNINYTLKEETPKYGSLRINMVTNTIAITRYILNLDNRRLSGEGRWGDGSSVTESNIPVGTYAVTAGGCQGDFGGGSLSAGTSKVSPTTVTIQEGKTASVDYWCMQKSGGGGGVTPQKPTIRVYVTKDENYDNDTEVTMIRFTFHADVTNGPLSPCKKYTIYGKSTTSSAYYSSGVGPVCKSMTWSSTAGFSAGTKFGDIYFEIREESGGSSGAIK